MSLLEAGPASEIYELCNVCGHRRWLHSIHNERCLVPGCACPRYHERAVEDVPSDLL